MKKGVLVVLLSILFVLTACTQGTEQNNNESATPNQEGAQSDKTIVTYWTADRHDQDFMQAVIDQFNKENTDNIEVQMRVFSENYAQSVDLAFSSNQAPDILRTSPTVMKPFYEKGYLEPLDDYASNELKEKFASSMIENNNQFDGKIYSFPNYGYTKRLIYNVDLFEKAGIESPPKTLDEMVEVAKKLTEAGKDQNAYGFAANFKNPVSALERSTFAIAQLSGIPGDGYDFATGEYDFSGYKPILEAYRQMAQDGSMLPGVEALDIDPLRAQFAEGNIGMYLSVSAEISVFENQFPAKIRWAAALPPTVDGNYEGAMDLGNAGSWLSLTSKSENKEAAWKFIEYMYNDSVLTQYHEEGLGLSIVGSVLENADIPDVENVEGFLPTKYDALMPVPPVHSVQGRSYQDAFVAYMLTGGNLDEIINDLNSRYNAGLQQAVKSGSVELEIDPDFSYKDQQGMFVK